MTLFTLAVPLLALAAVPLQTEQDDLPLDGGAHPIALAASRPTQVFFQETGDTIWARGLTYKASVAADGFTYIPFLGSDAPRNWPIRFHVTSVTIGGHELVLTEAEVRLSGARFELDRGAMTVRYDLGVESVEQSFALDGVAGTDADLVVRVAVDTDLATRVHGAGFAFEGPDGGASFGAATVLDGDGRSLAIDTVRDGNELVFRVPRAFLSVAEGTVIVDPLISTVTVDDYTVDLEFPDVAYEKDGDTYCVAYQEYFSAADSDIYCRTLDASTLLVVDEGYVSMTAARALHPKVASLAQNDSFLVVYQLADSLFRPEIFARKRSSAAMSAWGPEVLIASFDEFFFRIHHDVGGEAFEGAGTSNYFVVWEVVDRAFTGFPSEVEGVLIDGDGNPNGSVIEVTTSLANDNEWPSVSKSTGDPILHGAWWVAYKSHPVGGSSGAVRGARIAFDGTVTDPDDELFSAGPGAVHPSEIAVSAPYEGAYGESVHIAFQQNIPSTFVADTTILSLARTGSGMISVHDLVDRIQVSAPSSYFAGKLATLADRAVHITTTRDLVTNVDTTLASTLELVLGAEVAVGERRTVIGARPFGAVPIMDATSHAAGGDLSSRRIFTVWGEVPAGGTSSNIYGAVLEFPEPAAIGGNVCRGFPNSTGDYSYLTAFGDNSTTSPKSLRATNLPPGALGYFLAAPMSGGFAPAGSDGLLCLGGSIGRYAGSVLSSGSAGRFDFVIDPTSIAQPTGSVPAMVGDRWFFQAWHRDANPAPTSNFTNAIMIGF